MTRPWKTLETVPTKDGDLKLLKRGDDDFMITISGRVLMVSQDHRSELALARLACRALAGRKKPKILIGGLGMGYTLRAALDELPDKAEVVVSEIAEQVVHWCRGPLSPLTDKAISDPRVRVEVTDVADLIAEAARAAPQGLYDAIILDLYQGPNEANRTTNEPFYGPAALMTTRAALKPNGIFAVWSEDPDTPFEKRLRSAGFHLKRHRPTDGTRRHVVYLATSTRGSRPKHRRST